MHRKLVESALLVFAQKGVDASVIEDVIAAADVSRGTFYNYFRTNGDLLAATIEELGNELVERIEDRVKSIPSPGERLFTGLRLYLGAARRYPLFARFMRKVGWDAIGAGSRVNDYIPVHIAEAIAAGEFIEQPIEIALDTFVGIGLAVVSASRPSTPTRLTSTRCSWVLRGRWGSIASAPMRRYRRRSRRLTRGRSLCSRKARPCSRSKGVARPGRRPRASGSDVSRASAAVDFAARGSARRASVRKLRKLSKAALRLPPFALPAVDGERRNLCAGSGPARARNQFASRDGEVAAASAARPHANSVADAPRKRPGRRFRNAMEMVPPERIELSTSPLPINRRQGKIDANSMSYRK